MRALGGVGTQSVALLQLAAVLGLSFRRDEVMCAAGTDETETSRLLRYCRDEHLLELTEDLCHFAHGLYREHFLGLGVQDRPGVHERLMGCLRNLRPGEYDLRCLNAVEAERPREAGALGIQAALQEEREGRPWRSLAPQVLQAIAGAGLNEVADRFATAQHHLDGYRYKECLETLSRLPRNQPKNLSAEADYLQATCLMATRSEDDRASALAILDAWSGYEEEEPELGIRLMQLQLYGLAMLQDKTDGVRLENRIKHTLSVRSGHDMAAEDALYTMDRCSGSLHKPEYAVQRTQDAADHFGPVADHTLVRRPVEYYRALTNLGANLIVTAQYERARTVHADLQALIAGHEPGAFPRLDYAHMNTLLADHRAGVATIEEAVERQREVVASHEVPGDPFYVENALAVYLGLAGRHAEALEIFDRLLSELMQRRNPEPSMEYLLRANRAALCFVDDDSTATQAEWSDLRDLVVAIPYATQPYLVRRHELLGEVVAAGTSLTARELDECLIAGLPPQFGPLWDHVGRGFWLPEIEWWR
jgi:tetratricopeptide (TPR) repeat protein